MAKKTNGTTVGVSVGVAAAAAAAGAAAYWLYGAKNAARHRKQAKSWMLKARADVLDAVERMTDIDKSKYLQIVDQVVKRYAGTAGATAQDLKQMAKDLQASWVHMQTAGKRGARGAGAARKAVKRVTKKSPARKAK